MSAPGSKKKLCPYCDEEIPVSATICRFCREELPKSELTPKAGKKKSSPEQIQETPARPGRGSSKKAQPVEPPAPPVVPAPWNEDDGPPTYEVRAEAAAEEKPRKRRSDEDEDEDEDEDDRPNEKRKPSLVDEYDEEVQYRRKGGKKARFAPCPSCGSRDSKRIAFTLWGGLIGPLILCHVRCQRCQTAYNGRSGESNTVGIVIYLLVGLVIGGLAAAAAAIIVLKNQ